MAKATSGLPRLISSHTIDQDTYLAYHPTRGICIIPEAEVGEIRMYDYKVKFEGDNHRGDYEFTWLIGELHANTTEGLDVIPFTDIIKITLP